MIKLKLNVLRMENEKKEVFTFRPLICLTLLYV